MVDGTWSPARGDVLLDCRLDDRLDGRPGSTVWRAWSAALARDVAVKVMARDEVDPAAVRQLEAAMRRLRAVSPPYAADVIDVGMVDDHVVLVTRLAAGEELRHVVRRDGPVDPALAVQVVAQVAACLDAAHRADIVHGEVDARHVRVTGDGREHTASLVEFGLRRRRRPGTALRPCLAPEVRRGQEPTVASDVYGLASLLHVMVTGVQPGEPAPFPRWDAGARGRLLAVAALGLAESPADRPPDARALSDAAAMALDLVPYDATQQRTPSGQPTEQPRITREPLVDVPRAEVPPAVPPRRPTPVAPPRAEPTPTTPSAPPRAESTPTDRRASRAGVLVAAAGLAVIVATALLLAVRPAGEPGDDPGARAAESVGDASRQPASSPPSTSPVEIVGTPEGRPGWATVRPGVLGPQVTAFEWLLYANGAGARPDGVYDAPTVRTVSDFQVQAGLPVSGLVDPGTWERLAQPVVPGDQGPRVRALQQLLRVEQRLPVSGSYDDRTAAAVAAFQRRTGLTLTGEADVDTWAALTRAWG